MCGLDGGRCARGCWRLALRSRLSYETPLGRALDRRRSARGYWRLLGFVERCKGRREHWGALEARAAEDAHDEDEEDHREDRRGHQPRVLQQRRQMPSVRTASHRQQRRQQAHR